MTTEPSPGTQPDPSPDAPPAPSSPAKTIAAPVPQSTGPDRFDQLAQVVRPRLLLAVGVIVLVIVAALVWACTATITNDVTLAVAVTPETYFADVPSPANGTVSDTQMRSGDPVTAGQVIAKVTTPEGQTLLVRSPTDAVVSSVYATDGSTVRTLDNLAVLAPSNEPRVLTAFPSPATAAELHPGQPIVAQVAGCPALVTTVDHVALLPVTTQVAVERIGEQAVADAIMPAATGVPMLANVPDSWCPSLKAGVVASMTVTIGSTHPIAYISP